MSSVAAHPLAPAATRHSSSRFGQLLKPLRKSTSTKDLHKVAAYDNYQTTSPPLLLNTNTSPLDDAWQSAGSRSPTYAHSPPVSFGFTSNKARLGRALGESSRAEGRWADDADYIPYRGPISPPPDSTSSFAQQQQQQQRPESGRLPLQAQHSNLIGVDAASSGRSFIHSGQQSDREAAPSIPRFRDVQYAPSTSTAAPDSNIREGNPSATRGRFIGTGLPSAYSHGGNAPSQGSSSTVRSVANQSYLPSLLRFDTSADAGSSSNLKQIRDVQVRQPISTISRMPVATSPPLVKHSFPTGDRIDHTSKAASLSSSDGHHSSLINQESRSTSMTSLRDQSSIHGSKLRRPSQEGPPLSASAKSHSKIISSPSITQTSFQQHESASSHHRETDSSSTTASIPALARNFVEGHNVESLSQDDEATPKAGKRLQREVVPASPLSTVPASTPDLRSSQSAADFTPAKHDAPHQQDQGSPTPRGREDANQKYLLLQQMHLDEAASHAPDNDGWLEPNSGCERLLMPKPALKGKKSAPEVRSLEGVSFGRNRRGQLDNGESSSMADAATAQAILSGAEYSSKAETTEGTDKTPVLFHHRMPPATPDVNRDASATHLTRPTHVEIPPRRSSQSRRQRAKSATPATSTRRPAKDDDDNDSVPDLATVLAQGRALDEERERWREQYRRSLMKARGERSKSRDGLSKKVRYHEKALPDIPALHDRTPIHLQTPIRQAKSTPDMRKSMSRGAYKDTKDAGVVDMCIAPFRDTPHQQSRDQQQQKQHLRKRSQSQGCLASAFGFSRKSRRQRAASLSPEAKTEKAATSDGTVREKPAVDGRAATSKSRNVSGAKAGDSKAFRFPFTKTATPSTTMPSDTSYGIAYSAPRPSIGQAVPKEETFAAGRHATTKQYHMHTNSDDIKVMLSSSGHQSEEDHLQQKPDGQGSETDTRGRSATSRGDSLGLSHVTQLKGDLKQVSDTAAQAPPLPIHPLEKKKSQASPASVSVNLHPPTLVGALKGFPAADGQRKTPVSSTSVLNSEAKAFPKMEELEGEIARSEPSQRQKFVNRRGSRRSKDNAKRLTAQSTASTSSSSYSPHSVAARELWNTDDHPEEAFQELFVRRPGLARHSLTKGGVDGVPRIVEPQSPLQTGDFATRDFEHSLLNESGTGDSLYRASLDSKRDSAHIEKLVGSYLNTLSPPVQTDETLERTGMQESDVDLYRQGIRLGRVGSGRTPVISPASHSANEQDGPSDEEYEEPRMSSTRARMDSLAASLVLPTEGNSPDLHEAPLPPSEAKEVISDQVDEETEKQHSTDRSSNESLIDIVRNIVWPDPPKNSKKE